MLDERIMNEQIGELAEAMLKKNPEIGAFLLTSGHLAPFAWKINQVTGLPVADMLSLSRFVFKGVVAHTDYKGFI